MVHDPIVYSPVTRQAGKIEITSKGTPVFRVKPIDLKEAKDLRRELLKRMVDFAEIRDEVLLSQKSWPDIPAPEEDPMRVTFVLNTASLGGEKPHE